MRRSGFGYVAFCLSMAVAPLWAHHSIVAEYDDKKPMTLRGTVTKFDWDNPHVYIWMDVRDAAGRVTNWAVEYDSTLDLKRSGNGWNRDIVKVGDTVTAEGILARDGSKQISGKSLTVPGGKKLAAANPAAIKLAPVRTGASKEAPRWPNGHVRLGAVPGGKGFWADPSPGGLYETSAGNIRMDYQGQLANIADAGKVAPFQPWAKRAIRISPAQYFEGRSHGVLPSSRRSAAISGSLRSPRSSSSRTASGFLLCPQSGNRNWRLIFLDGRKNH